MSWLRNLPIQRKLSLVILLTCSMVLLLACFVLGAYQLFDFRRALVRDMTVLADILAKNTRAALAFQDDKAARETLLALQSEPSVEAACLFDKNNSRFADYRRSGASVVFPNGPGVEGYAFQDGHLLIFRRLTLNGKRIGTIYIRADLQGIHERLVLFAGVAAMVLLGSCLVAFGLSRPLQRPVSQPVLALAEKVRNIAQQKDYSVQLPQQNKNEMGLLTDAFNQLLAGIEERSAALGKANETLHREVEERKSAEDRVQSQLARLEMLHQITRSIGERQDLKSIFQVVIRTIEEHLPVDFACICLYEPAGKSLVVNSVGVRSEALAMDIAMKHNARVDVDQNDLLRCVNGRLVYEPEIQDSPFPFPKRLASGGLRAFVAAPLLVESQVFGVFIAARRQPRSFSSGECEFLRQLSEHVALAAHQAQLYSALQQAYDDLRNTQQAVMQQERLRALGQMASGIAHDINNAMSPVALYTESLLDTEKNLSSRARDYLQTIQHSVEDVTQTVARMREFYRQREPQLTLVKVSLNELVKQVIDLSRARWSDMPQQRGVVIKVITDLEPDLPVILGAESEIREALINLVFNAVDAMPEGGILTLRTISSTKGSENANFKHASIEVIDTGVGMEEDTRRRCLEPFFTTKGERGTGLGLAMVYGIAKRNNADIEIVSEPGKGTTMRLIFPVPPTLPDDSTEAAGAFIAPTRLRILVVDDDPLLIKSLRDALETDGHLVTTANGGHAGVAAFSSAHERAELFDVLITDLGMPHMDGRQVASLAKSISPSTPVILLTGWGQRLLAESDVPPNVDLVLSKPPKLREIRKALAQCLVLYKE